MAPPCWEFWSRLIYGECMRGSLARAWAAVRDVAGVGAPVSLFRSVSLTPASRGVTTIAHAHSRFAPISSQRRQENQGPAFVR
ncbi:hypothetical protein SAMN04488504_10691 [Myxococcus virescens]|uniref:Uncharacterized protein n=1 Tax=Myxococcus virescens TaxID=83456 RepID=A0ABY0MRP6_9BACT|nr:hypothetical protein SAMN04488504_10691 [Myxococcus virescens]